MLFTIDLADTIEFDDPISSCKDKIKKVYQILKNRFSNRNYQGYHIVKVLKIKRCSTCRIVYSNLSAKGRVDILFTALVRSIDSYLANMKIFNITDSNIHGVSDDHIIVATLEKNKIHELIQMNQYVPITINFSSCDPFKKYISVTGELLHCDTSFTIYKTTEAKLNKEQAKSLMFYINEIYKELILRNDFKTKPEYTSLQFFDLLLHPNNLKTADTQIIKFKQSIDWEGGMKTKIDSSYINLLDTIKDFVDSKNEYIDLSGFWSRPLDINRSCPLVKKENINTTGIENYVEQPIHIILANLLKTMTIITIIRELAEQFKDNTSILSHKNIWQVMQQFKK